jgi:hypothetical protein
MENHTENKMDDNTHKEKENYTNDDTDTRIDTNTSESNKSVQEMSNVEQDKKDAVILDLNEIKKRCKENEIVKINDICKIRLYTKEEEDRWEEKAYLGEISNGKFTYLGILSNTLQRSEWGENTYTNKDVYLGHWDKNRKNLHGIYIHKIDEADKNSNKLTQEVYHGRWKDGNREGPGIYIWKELPNSADNNRIDSYETSTFDAFVGILENDNYKWGLYLNKEKNKRSAYLGGFNGIIKEEKEALYYLLNDDGTEWVFLGEILNNEMRDGFIINKKTKEVSHVNHSIEQDSPRLEATLLTDETKKLEIEEKVKEKLKLLNDGDNGDVVPESIYKTVFEDINNCIILSEKKIKHMENIEENFTELFNTTASYNDIVKFVIPKEKFESFNNNK